jgi:hypothetical protein
MLPSGAEARTIQEGTRPRSDAGTRRGCVPVAQGLAKVQSPFSAARSAEAGGKRLPIPARALKGSA